VPSESGPASGGGGAFGECGHNLFKARLFDHGDRSARFDPLCCPLMGLESWPQESGQFDKWIFCLTTARLAEDQEIR
jgi:hypothetical protein